MRTALPLVVVAAFLASGLAGPLGARTRAGGASPPTRMVTICKQTCPTGGTNFQFTRSKSSGPLNSFTLDGGQCVTYDLTNEDTANTITENVPAGWTLTNISCNNTTTPVKFTGANSNPAFQSGDNAVSLDVIEPNVTCVFTNERLCTPPPTGMVSWWLGDGNAADIAGGFGGTPHGAAGYAAGRVGLAFNFPANGYVQVPDNPAHIPQGSFTIDAWVLPQGTAQGRMTVVSKYECGGTCLTGVSNSAYLLYLDNGVVNAYVRDTDAGPPSGQTLTGPNVADGQWHHLAMVRDVAANQFLLYVGGALAASAPPPLNAGANSMLKDEDQAVDHFYIGAQKIGSPSYQADNIAYMQFFFIGMIDEVEYFNRALTGKEVAAIHGAGSNGKCK